MALASRCVALDFALLQETEAKKDSFSAGRTGLQWAETSSDGSVPKLLQSGFDSVWIAETASRVVGRRVVDVRGRPS